MPTKLKRLVTTWNNRKVTKKEVAVANSTCRCGGVVGKKAIVPRLVSKVAKKSDRILDFGAGKEAFHAQRLKRRGWNVTAFDFGDNFDEAIHDANALKYKYNLVYASNVLNVQSSRSMLESTISQIRDATSPGGKVIMNYPDSPRKIEDLDADELTQILSRHFSSLKLIMGTPSAPVYLATR